MKHHWLDISFYDGYAVFVIILICVALITIARDIWKDL